MASFDCAICVVREWLRMFGAKIDWRSAYQPTFVQCPITTEM